MEFIQVPWSPTYRACSEGWVESFRRGKWHKLKGAVTAAGYYKIEIGPYGGKLQRYVHSIICESFHGPRPPGMEVRHLDGNGQNNKASNLKWGTPAENQADRALHGTSNRGERCASAKLTAEKVISIRSLIRDCGMRQSEVAAMMGVHAVTISNIMTGTTWSHV